MTEQEKIAALKQFERMIYKQVNRVNSKRFLSHEDCEELANTFRFKVWKSFDRYDGSVALSTWGHHTLNLAGASFFYHYFKDTVKKVDSQSLPLSGFFKNNEEGDDRDRGKIGMMFSCTDDGFEKVDVQCVLDSIPSRRYSAMLIDRMNGMTYRELGEKWGISHQAARQYMQEQAKKVKQYV